MAINKECKAKIWRYHFVEYWGVNAIASQWGIHHSTVDRVLSPAGLPKVERAISPSIIDPYVPFMLKTLEPYPTLTAARLYDMALERGFTGAVSHFRARVAQLRPRPVPEAYLRLNTLPGEQAQMDWGSFSHIHIGKTKNAVVRPASLARYDQLNPGRAADQDDVPETPAIPQAIPGENYDGINHP